MNQSWILPPHIRDEMLQDGQDRYPEEACGLLFGSLNGRIGTIERYLPVANHSQIPLHAFELDPAIWVRSCFDPRLIGVYHTHPTSPPQPSSEDLRQLPNFADRLQLYLIGGRMNPSNDKPPGEPDGFMLHAYGISAYSGGYRLLPIKLREN
ncbi:M67 family metallopeptidase [Paenibacillus barengoltzii]|jgi:proteasome lid subunit RPN8/RPN11|uniref:JAB domain-containing protein n=2 Tax=Paenibacillus barengoltzii TaxID=343517 RepID=R9LC78_9BACL|nr:M67 family metallopeptidase [Paenibacillus barengoltzii]EOS56188.1 hypothetical protein C812_02253 [Paenibacillus barengoltzii G22]SMF17909.1 Proteasome lid subunit RPN8/RPN11, contains Jab1/MPN metalloenzyme (JAMM) motif [Paenibacillus barengoltzii J12]